MKVSRLILLSILALSFLGCYRSQELVETMGESGDTDTDSDSDSDTDQGPGPDTDSDQGSSVLWEMRGISAPAFPVDMVFLADLNGDGTLDVLAASSSTNDLTWYENTGSPGEWTGRVVPTAQPPSHVRPDDLDLDGDSDLVLSSSVGDAVSWLENVDGVGDTWVEEIIDDEVHYASRVESFKLFGDNSHPVVMAASAGSHNLSWEGNYDLTLYAEGAIGNSPWGKYVVETTLQGVTQMVAERFEGEFGQYSLLGVDTDGKLGFWESTGLEDEWFNVGELGIILNQVGGLDAGDFDGDGDIDVVASLETDNDVVWVENTIFVGAGWENLRSLVGGSGGFPASGPVHSVDVNSDGIMDVVGMSSSSNKVVWWENSGGGGTTWVPHTICEDLAGLSYIETGDMDGDGDSDVVVVESGVNELTWFENPL